MNIELPLKCPLPAGGRSYDNLKADGEGWEINADPHGYAVHISGEGVFHTIEKVASDARTNLQRGFEALRTAVAAQKGTP